MTVVGVVGLGSMGSVLANNLVGAALEVVTHDVAGPASNPPGAHFVGDVGELAERVDIAVFSLPNGAVSHAVADELCAAPQRRVRCVVDTSTVGPSGARAVAALCEQQGVGYVDAPVSGGIAGARQRTLMVMYAGSDHACADVGPVLAGLSDRRQRVGDRAGMAQALKVANNFLSALALAATSEAIWFLVDQGLDMGTALEVINASSGRSAATSDKFPDHVVTGTFAAGFANTLMAKDVSLYLAAVEQSGGPAMLGRLTESMWQEFAAAEPGADFTRIYPFVAGTRLVNEGVDQARPGN